MCGSDAACCQITLTTCYSFSKLITRQRRSVNWQRTNDVECRRGHLCLSPGARCYSNQSLLLLLLLLPTMYIGCSLIRRRSSIDITRKNEKSRKSRIQLSETKRYSSLNSVFSNLLFAIICSCCYLTCFTARRHASAVYGVVVCLSFRLSQVGVLLKRLNVGSRKQRHTIAQGLVFCCRKSGQNSNGVTPKEIQNAGGVGEDWRLFVYSGNNF